MRFCRRICLEATTVEIETLTPRLVSTVAWFLSERLDGLLLMLFEFYRLTVPRTMSPSCRAFDRLTVDHSVRFLRTFLRTLSYRRSQTCTTQSHCHNVSDWKHGVTDGFVGL